MASEKNEFPFESALKYRPEDTFLNFQHYLLFSSKQITKFLYKTPVTPHQVILFSMIIGIVSSFLMIQESILVVILGAIMLYYKNVLDKVDGSLARARGMASRRGRFYDSISDFIVSFALFTAMGVRLNAVYQSIWVWIICYAALVASMIQCSFFIYYEVAFIKETGKQTINRLLESVTEEDLQKENKVTIMLQRTFQLIYGWQDYIVYRIDKFFISRLLSKRENSNGNLDVKFQNSNLMNIWYRDKSFLSLASLLCIGSHMVLIAVFAVAGKFEYYLVLNLILWNLLLIYCVFYHYYHIKSKLKIPEI